MTSIGKLGLVIKGINASLLYEESHHNLNVRGVFFHAIAVAHQGKIKVKSKLGKGSTFTVNLPIIN